MSTTSRDTVEIAAPAGNLEKLRMAVLYGADSVYFGGDRFNLRARAGNLSIEEIKEGTVFCKNRRVKTVLLLNSFLHETDIQEAKSLVRDLVELEVDAVMISDPGMLMLLQEENLPFEIYLSTQASTLNHLAIRFWQRNGIRRIVLARETTLEQISRIRQETDAELEVFAHGAVCISYSGRCLLSRYLSGRDANAGDCSHPCRWEYSLMEKKRPGNYMEIVEHNQGTEILSSKDLNILPDLPDYITAGVDAFKIEGRMKSIYHAANATRIYRHAADLSGTDEFEKYLPFWEEELDLINHRPYTRDLFNEFGQLGFNGIPYVRKTLFLGYGVRDGRVRVFNPIYPGETVNIIYPIEEKIIDHNARVVSIVSSHGSEADMARPGETLEIMFDPPLAENAILRRILPDEETPSQENETS